MELKTFRDQLFTDGEKYGFTDMELYYEKSDQLNCQVFEGEVDRYENATVHGVSLRGIYEGKTGYAYTEKIEEDSIPYLLKNAKENAALMEKEPEELFAGAEAYRNIDLYTPALDEVTPEEFITFLKETEEKMNAYDERVVQTNHASVQRQSIEKALYNNKGLSLEERNNFIVAGMAVLVKEGEELKSGMKFKVIKDFADLNPDELAKETVEKALSALGGKVYPNKNYSVILKNFAAATLLAT